MEKTNELARILASNFGLTNLSSALDTESAYLDHLKLKLSARIKFFIRTDLDKLLQALYRIDIDDSLSSEAFDLGEINKVSDRLSELIVMRQLQKIDYSKKFSGN